MTTPRTPARVFLRNSQEVRVDRRLSRGGEGTIFSLHGDAERVLKVYHKVNQDRVRKLEAMLAAVPVDPWRQRSGLVSICWPEELAFNEVGQVVGFLMPRIDTAKYAPVGLLWNREDRGMLMPGFTWKYLCVAAANFSSLMELIHARGHVIGDVNEENTLVNNSAITAVVDCDSMQVRDSRSGKTFRSPVSRDAFISPERLGKALVNVDRTATDDYWALAVLIFSMLLEGLHPTDGIGYPPERDRRLRLGLFPMLGESGFAPPKYALPVAMLPEPILRLFQRCFRDGHANPAKRPSAVEWKHTLRDTAATLVHCPARPLHWYASHLASCPWCDERRLIGIDRFEVRPPLTTKVTAPSPSPQAPTIARWLRALFN